ncbi:MAG: nicotinamide riboside transporter PnuC [Bacteroidota bacterium]
MLQQFIQDLQSLGLLDWVVTLTALIYVVLSARNNPLCWVFGIISCALWAYASYAYYDLYADALLQVFYVVMGFVGLYNWQNGRAKQEDTLDSPLPETKSLPINRASVQQHVIYITIGLTSGLLLGYAFKDTAAAATYYDALTTSFSIIATIMLVRRNIENWLYWIIIDLAYAGLYYSRGAILFAVLMIIYVVIAFFAYWHWRRLMTT